eukprot:TRINITY_DN201_c0_g2_i1.p1 TRINITY_DN201_c0_g2~~TRINITY_DN201_c0_g2_i1.p1  ORF type:complete len:417 (+),score=90.20 TRINITY_DN201_c0_g2_i1:144-1253(+)
MANPSPAIYGMKEKSRNVVSILAETEKDMFFVGTCSLHQRNQIDVIRFEEDGNSVECDVILDHPNEVWRVIPTPTRKTQFITIHNSSADEHGVTLWEAPILEDTQVEMPDGSITALVSLGQHASVPQNVCFDPLGPPDHVVSIDQTSVYSWRLDHGEHTAVCDQKKRNPGCRRIFSMDWDPNHAGQILLGGDGNINGWDLRSKALSYTIERAHEMQTTEVQFNPNHPYHIVSGGGDGRIKVWDVRQTREPLVILSGHAHWVSCLRFNPFHDQLLLSSGTDSLVNLWRVSSASVDASGGEHSGEGDAESMSRVEEGGTRDDLISRIDDHEESVYSVAWSSHSAWIFATLSYDGRVLVHQVPSSERYRILL